MIDFWSTVADHLGAGRRVFLALVAANTKHSPGTVGARLAMAEGGEVWGTVGGGVMERDILAMASRVLMDHSVLGGRETPAPWLETLAHRRPSPGSVPADGTQPSGMICAGQQTNLYAVLDPGVDAGTVSSIVDLLRRDAPGVLEISSRGVALRDSPSDTPSHTPSTPAQLSGVARSLDMGEYGFHYREPLLERRRLVIFGGGHCALALARVMGPLGYRLTACEATKKSPEADLASHVHALHPVDDFRRAAARVPWPELTAAVVMTSDFPGDIAALCGALRQPFPFIGVMGSPAKLRKIRQGLVEQGFGDADFERLTAPVGLPIGSHTPEEIAISVAAQILDLRRGWTP